MAYSLLPFRPLSLARQEGPPPPPEMSGRGDREALCTMEQQFQLRNLTWLLSRTNGRSAPPVIKRQHKKSSTTMARHEWKQQKKREHLYFQLEALANITERNHESIAIYTGDVNGFNTYVATSFSSAVPATLNHVVVSEDDMQQHGHVLNLPHTTMNQHPREPMTGWSQDPAASRVRLVKAMSVDSPVPLRVRPRAPTRGYARWLMDHTIGKVNDHTFVTDITASEHIGNVAQAVKEAHREPDKTDHCVAANAHLGMYVYLNCAARCHETISRGFEEYGFGRLFTIDISCFGPREHSLPMLVFQGKEIALLGPEFWELEKKERDVLEQILKRGLSCFEIVDPTLNPDLPGSLVKRTTYYDADGRVHFHRLLSLILRNVRLAASNVVDLKRSIMQKKLRGGTASDLAKYREGAERMLQRRLLQMFHSYRILNEIRVRFKHTIESHALWLVQALGSHPKCRVTAYRPPGAARPPGLRDEYASLDRHRDGPTYGTSCCKWLALLCRQERALARLRPGTSRHCRWVSTHISHANVWHVSVTADAHRWALMSPTSTIEGLGFEPAEAHEVLRRLVQEGRVSAAEAWGGGVRSESAVSALQLTVLLHEMERRRASLELTASTLAQLVASRSDGLRTCPLPDADITRRFRNHDMMAIGSNGPACRGSRLMLRWAMSEGVLGCMSVYDSNGGRCWAQLDLPPWALRDAAGAIIDEARRSVEKRVLHILMGHAAKPGENESCSSEEER